MMLESGYEIPWLIDFKSPKMALCKR